MQQPTPYPTPAEMFTISIKQKCTYKWIHPPKRQINVTKDMTLKYIFITDACTTWFVELPHNMIFCPKHLRSYVYYDIRILHTMGTKITTGTHWKHVSSVKSPSWGKGSVCQNRNISGYVIVAEGVHCWQLKQSQSAGHVSASNLTVEHILKDVSNRNISSLPTYIVFVANGKNFMKKHGGTQQDKYRLLYKPLQYVCFNNLCTKLIKGSVSI
jgi:hypothetical protein